MLPAPRFVELQTIRPGLRLFTSLEGENPSGSIKDRMVFPELSELLERGRLRPGDWVSEVSAGSTARSLAYFCAKLGLRCAVFVPTGIPEEAVAFLESHGAEVHRAELGTIYEEHESFVRRRKTHPFDQLGDPGKRRHYHAFGKRLLEELGEPVAVVGGVGTGHSLLGTAEGSVGKSRCWSAEPEGFSVSGIRNLDAERHGDHDCCRPEDFGRRILVSQQGIFKGKHLVTDVGPIEISDSFRVVLGAVDRIEKHAIHHGIGIFLLGSSNRKVLVL